ncbi:adenosine receptor A3 [Amyelois transitella]|uniref:adenosine receptor A3 n=1 Tax=Amyelois transitella TaxID=680683 RepID=UPI00298F8E09|nr:adenosine receptor A3 [Amyelois transitella]
MSEDTTVEVTTFGPVPHRTPTPELHATYTSLEILVALVAIVGNAMVIYVFHRDRRLRRRTNYYIVSLAVADFLVGLLGIPFAILASVGLPRNLHACLFTVSLLVMLCTISIFCLVGVSVDRYWAILHPMCYSRNVRTRTAIVIISVCWVSGAFVGLLPLFGWHADVEAAPGCYFVEVMDYNYLLFLYFATIVTPSVLLAGFYAHIYRVVVKQMSEVMTVEGSRGRMAGGTMLRVLGAAQKREVKATQNLAIIVFFFIICWIPLYTINAIKTFKPDLDIPNSLTYFCIIFSHLNSAINPLLYAYHLKDFRAALKGLLCTIIGRGVPIPAAYRPPVPVRRPALERCNALRERPKVYVNSPVWLRQKEAETAAAEASRVVSISAPAVPDVEPFLNRITDSSSGHHTPEGRESNGPYLIDVSEERGQSPYKRVEELIRRVRSVSGDS